VLVLPNPFHWLWSTYLILKCLPSSSASINCKTIHYNVSFLHNIVYWYYCGNEWPKYNSERYTFVYEVDSRMNPLLSQIKSAERITNYTSNKLHKRHCMHEFWHSHNRNLKQVQVCMYSISGGAVMSTMLAQLLRKIK
jgi:hypothetical protein